MPGHHEARDEGSPTDITVVGAGYFETVGIPILEGRAFTEDDLAQERRVAIVNQTMARLYWKESSAVGQLIYFDTFNAAPYEVIGVARDHKVRSIGESPRPYVHRPAGKSREIGLIVRTTMPAAASLPMLRQAIWALEPDIVFTADVSAAQIAATTMAPTRIGAMVLGAFGVLSLLLARVGIYGVVAYSVSRRTREVGVRMVLGAKRGQVLAMVFARGGRLAAAGIALGGIASVGLGRLLESLLYGVSGFDPLAYGIAAGVLVVIAGVANLVPAITAARVEPIGALRTE